MVANFYSALISAGLRKHKLTPLLPGEKLELYASK